MPNNKIDFKLCTSKSPGIWRFSPLLASVEKKYRLTLDEGNTSELPSRDSKIIFKREDKNPTGSLKDRGMAYLLSKLYSEGKTRFVLPSSGNAAISALSYGNLAKMKMKFFVSPKAEKGKLDKLSAMGGDVEVTEKTLSQSAKFSQENGYLNLRPSLNEFASEGYQTIAFELACNQGVIDDIFLPVSSGVCLLGIYQGFIKVGFMPRIHLCQSSLLNPLAVMFDRDFKPEETSVACALVARSVPLKEQILASVRNSAGTGWVIENEQILSAQEKLGNEGIMTSAEGGLAFAAIAKAQKKGWQLGKTVCLLTGKRY